MDVSPSMAKSVSRFIAIRQAAHHENQSSQRLKLRVDVIVALNGGAPYPKNASHDGNLPL